MDAIGGYFELELRKGEHYHKDALKLNTARNCFEYVLRARGYKKVYMPYYTCDVMFQPLDKLQIEYSFYHIDKHFEICEPPILNEGEAILYTNYFALKQCYVNSLANVYGSRLIVDNAQAFYAPRVKGIDTFYSARKFFGVPDGAYLYTECYLDEELEQDVSIERMSHLLKRIEYGAEAGYEDFKRSDVSLNCLPVKQMSQLTDALLTSVDYVTIAEKRRQNFIALDTELKEFNKLKIILDNDSIPLAYPYYTDETDLRAALISKKVYIPTYWPNVATMCYANHFEKSLSFTLLPLPVDQRVNEMKLLEIIKNII